MNNKGRRTVGPGPSACNGGRASLRRWLEKHSLLDPVGGIPRQQIEQMQVPATRPPGPTPMGREDAQYASCTPDQWSRQYGAHSGIEHHLQGGRTQKNWALSNVLEDDLCPSFERRTAHSVSVMDAIKELQKGLTKPALGLYPQGR
jgi:hypothetical protein